LEICEDEMYPRELTLVSIFFLLPQFLMVVLCLLNSPLVKLLPPILCLVEGALTSCPDRPTAVSRADDTDPNLSSFMHCWLLLLVCIRIFPNLRPRSLLLEICFFHH